MAEPAFGTVEFWRQRAFSMDDALLIASLSARAEAAEAEVVRYREFVSKLWLELDNAADAVGPVPDLVERNLRAWSKEAYALLSVEEGDHS